MPMKTKPREVINEKTGRYSVYALPFSFHVDDYDSSSYTVYNDSGQFAIFVRETECKSYEDACHRALNQARMNNMPVVAKKKKSGAISNGKSTKHSVAPKPKRAVVEDDDDDEDNEEEEAPKTTKRMTKPENARGNPREFYDLEFKLKGTRFILTGKLDIKGHDSNTGRSIIHLTSAGLWDTGVNLNGVPIILSFNGFTSKKERAKSNFSRS